MLGDRLLATPDFDRSDALHLNISLKHYLWQSLKGNRLPFWTDALQGGFPIFAEGQIGALFLPNLVFLKLFNFAIGYTLIFCFALLLLTIGTYILLLEHKVERWTALLLAFIFTFNGAITFRWIHLNAIQTFSLIPLLFAVAAKWKRTAHLQYGFIISALVAQMIFAGHFQIAFVSLLGIILWFATQLWMEKTMYSDTSKKLARFLFFITTGLVIALPQLVPTFMLSRYSSRGISQGYQFATSHSLPPHHLLSFFSPYLFGNPQNGSYPFQLGTWGVFWENTPYMGPFFMALIILGSLYLFARRSFPRRAFLSLILAVLFTLLALGKNSPIHFIFDIFPFSAFRTPPKFLLMACLFIIIAYGEIHAAVVKIGNTLTKIAFILLILNLAFLVHTAASYHVFSKASLLLEPPRLVKFLTKNGKYITLGFDTPWHNHFLKNGWKSNEDRKKYIAMNDYLIPNQNLIFGYPIFDINTGGLRLRRSDYMQSSIIEALSDGTGPRENKPESFSQLASVAGITDIISAYPLENPILSDVSPTEQYGSRVYHYKTAMNPTSKFYIPKRIKNLSYLEDLAIVKEKGFLSIESAVIEEYHDMTENGNNVQVHEKESGSKIMIDGVFPQETVIVFRKSWYPEMEVKIDGAKTPIRKVNLIHAGVAVPKGVHEITLEYVPLSFYWGLVAASIYMILIIPIYLKFLKR